MKRHLALLFLIASYGCQQKSNDRPELSESFSLSGTINGDYSDYIYLNYYGGTKDSTIVTDNKFEFTGSVKHPIQGWLHLEGDANIVWLYIENSEIRIQADYESKTINGRMGNSMTITKIEGSQSAKLEEEFRDFMQANESKENFSGLLYTNLQSFLKDNSSHPFSGKVLEGLAMGQQLPVEQLIELYNLIDTVDQDSYGLKIIRTKIKSLSNYGVGKRFIDFELLNPSSKRISIADYRGKITLVDFWASWCGPCRIKHPSMIELKDKLKNENFEILSVSIDSDKDKWIEAIEQDKLPWGNVWDADEENKNELSIIAIPQNYLLDEHGVIIGTNVSMEEIEEMFIEKTIE